MRPVHLPALDLNLLLVLDVLLRTASATQAARQLGRTQSAVSHSLQRLRELFDDPLFVRVGGRLRPTPRAEELRGPLAELTERAGALFAARSFDPARLERVFRLASTDLIDAAVLPDLLPRLGKEAPRVALVTRLGVVELELALQQRELDLAVVTTLRSAAGLTLEPLFEDRLALVLRRRHPALRGPLDLDTYCALRHVLVAPRGLPGSPVDDALAARRRQRFLALRTTSFTAALRVVASSDLVTALPSRFARAAHRAVVTRPLPLAVPPFRFHLAWSAALDADPAHRWFRSALRAALLAAFAGEGPAPGLPLA